MIHGSTLRLLLLGVVIGASIGVVAVTGQTSPRNNPYSPSPIRQGRESSAAAAQPAHRQTAVIREAANERPVLSHLSAPGSGDLHQLSPAETYKVGIGDVLFINLKNSPHSGGYYTVRSNGTIDYPLAGENIVVANQTIDEIGHSLRSRISLFPDPQVEVKVREYASHRVNVSGLVEWPGEKKLQREAVPLYVIKAEAVVDAKATKVIIVRPPMLRPETYSLRDPGTDNILIQPGNSVEFSAGFPSGSYHISGAIMSGGEKEISPALTLSQAIAASGGTTGNPKKVSLRRKIETGSFSVLEFHLQSIRDGKISDPPVLPGDVIEIGN